MSARRPTLEIWSDVVCPFCYIGKRQLEQALDGWPRRDEVTVVWRSFQLAPDTVTDPERSSVQNLAEKRGWTLEQTRQAIAAVATQARSVGLELDFDRTRVANTFDAHRLAHLGAAQGRGDAIQEALFDAYFARGGLIADSGALVEVAASAGIDRDDARATLASDRYGADVHADLQTAARLGIQAVPCFVFNRRYAVSGAQGAEILRGALQQALGD